MTTVEPLESIRRRLEESTDDVNVHVHENVGIGVYSQALPCPLCTSGTRLLMPVDDVDRRTREYERRVLVAGAQRIYLWREVKRG